MTMYVVTLVPITPAMLTSSTVAEPSAGEVVWNPAINYALGNEVYSPTSHHVYENTMPGVDGTSPENAPARWYDLGATNRMAMFDITRNKATTSASPLIATFAPGQRVDTLALIGMVGVTSLEISMGSGGSVVYDVVRNLNKRVVNNSYDYCFAPFGTQPDIVEFDLPPYSGGSITVTLLSDYGQLSCDFVMVGSKTDIGDIQWDAVSDVANYSTVTRDTDGSSEFVPVPNVPLTTVTVITQKAKVDQVRALRLALNAKPALWAGLPDDTDGYFGMMLTLAFYRQFTLNLSNPAEAVLNIKLEGI